ncbi:hypothetical protein [Pseudonocardia acidicola]|uniref:Uncharacterized protein n=1 Tax=Pseudonocardia acidicola TaxID=2724939 RepID=A0ABX1S9Q7_9PSEU|nr:hypothetical protein [Pseudonocardia acidicola]NMH96898.1 hypothetical protein [Pseudonocardia acidicola]
MTLPSRRHVAVLTIPEADLVELPDLGSVVTVRTAWRHELARISREDD